MIKLEDRCATLGREEAGQRHLGWLLSEEISGGTDIPFFEEAVHFRDNFDSLIAVYDNAMSTSDLVAVKNLP